MSNDLITLGVPVKSEAANIPRLILVLNSLVDDLISLGLDVEILVNDNCSSDNSLELLEDWAKNQTKVLIHKLSFPLTFQESILDLMSRANGAAFVVYQSDLQDPPEIVIQFVKKWLQGANVVAGVAIKRAERLLDRATRKVFYFLLKRLSDGHFIPGFQDFYLVSRPVYQQLIRLPRFGAFIRGHISTRFGDVEIIEYERRARILGQTNFNFAAKYSLALDGLLLFGTRFIRFVSVLSFIIFALSMVGILTLFIAYALGVRFGSHGWASLTVVILAVLSLFGFVSGLILEYLIRIYRTLTFNN